MALKRKYDEGCAVAHALDLVGERWALLVVRELLLGPKRFSDLRTGLPGASPDVLTQRLRELEEVGVVGRRRLARPASSWVYELTDWGYDLEPIVVRLAQWGSRSGQLSLDARTGVDSLALSFKALFDAQAANGFEGQLGLRLGEDSFRLTVADGGFDVVRDELDGMDAVLETDPETLKSLLWKGRKVAAAVRDGAAELTGRAAYVDRFLRMFPLPADGRTP